MDSPGLSGGSRKRPRDSLTEDVKPNIVDLVSDEDGSSDDFSLDEDDNDPEDEEVPGVCEYEESEEPLPTQAAYDQDFERIQQDLLKIPAQVIDVLDASNHESKRFENCREIASGLNSIPPPVRRKVALLGVTGAGKSSLVNSLLGMPTFARAMASGQSCTYVGTEYESLFGGQRKKFAAKVEYFDIKDTEELLKKLIDDYNTWCFEQSEDWEYEFKQDCFRLYTTALNTFTSLFCDKPEFQSPEVAADFLSKSYEDQSDGALHKMCAWCEALLEAKEADEADHAEYLDADSEAELHQHLEPLVTSITGAGNPKLWPLVKKVRIGIEGPAILDHITLVDLPGLDDTDRNRVNTSLQMMRDCDAIWVVSRIDRVITDTQVDSVLMRFGKDYDVVIVCTGIDEHLDPGLARHLQSEGQDIGDYYALHAREIERRRFTRNTARKIATGTAKLEGRDRVPPGRQRKQLTEKAKIKLDEKIKQFREDLHTAEIELAAVSQSRFELLVTARNSNTIARLRFEKAGHLRPGAALPIFCVSNYHYAALKGSRVIHGPRLAANATGIPEIREFIFVSAAPRLMTNVENFISHRFTVFMKGIAMLANSTSIQESDGLLDAVRAPQVEIDGCLRTFLDGLINNNDRVINKPLDGARQEIVECAREVMRAKGKWRWNTIRAFIRRDGNHRTSVAPQESWNEQFLKEASHMFEAAWTGFETKLVELGESLEEDLKDLINKTEAAVFDHPASYLFPNDRLRGLFVGLKYGVEQACALHTAATAKERRNIKLDMMHDRDTGFFTRAMIPAYEQSREHSGTGIKARMIATMEAHLFLTGDHSPFHVAVEHLSTALVRDAVAKNKTLSDAIETILRALYRQFEALVDESIIDDSEAAMRDQLRRVMTYAEVEFVALKEDLNSLKRRYAK